jgi:dipeptidyl aminopeptidase/acylaminoacyl peptidase
MGTWDYDDVISLVKTGISHGLIDEKRVVIGGWSQGGFLSYLAVTRPDFTFRGATCGSGVSDWDMMSMSSDASSFESELAGKASWEDGAILSQDRRGSAIGIRKTSKLLF